ncbi:MAG: hypothetical protein ACFFD8_08110 [Candidatus Thorarchaeota archaeon]
MSLLSGFEAYYKRVHSIGETYETSDLGTSPIFDYQTIPVSVELASELDYRLEQLASYYIKKESRATDILTNGLHIPSPMTFTRLQQRYITLLNKHPDHGIMSIAKKLEVSPRTAKREMINLFSQYGFHVAARLDYHQFGLVHYGVRFRAQSLSKAQKFDLWMHTELMHGKTLPFLLGYGWDVNQMDGCLFLLVPNQTLQLQRVKQIIEEIRNQYCTSIEYHEITGFYSNLSFDFYDHTSAEWQIVSDLLTEGTLKFIENHGPQFSALQGFNYAAYSHSFNQADWILALCLSEGLLTKHERQELLETLGLSLASKTIWTHENHIKKSKKLCPYVTYSRLAFNDFLCIFLTCDDSRHELLHQLLSHHAMSHIFPTKEGAILVIGIPTGGASFLKHLTRTLLTVKGIQRITPIRLKREPSWTPHIRTHILWNHKRTQWIEPRDQ